MEILENVHRGLTELCILPKGLATVFCVQENVELAARVRLKGTVHYRYVIYNLGWGTRVSDLVTSLA
jgi:hypothetical protein